MFPFEELFDVQVDFREFWGFIFLKQAFVLRNKEAAEVVYAKDI